VVELDGLARNAQERLSCLAITNRFAQIGKGRAQVPAGGSVCPFRPQQRSQFLPAVGS
jgi:hypothetical protein